MNQDYYNTHPAGIECREIAQHYPFNLGNAIKYAWRQGLKSDEVLKDLNKARDYLCYEIEKRNKRFGCILPNKTSLSHPSDYRCSQVIMPFSPNLAGMIESLWLTCYEYEGDIDDVIKAIEYLDREIKRL